MAETVIAPGNKLQVHRRAPQRERPRMSGFLGAGGAASDSQLAKGGKVKPGKGKHRLHLIIVMLGKRHPGVISEKAAKRRKLDAAHEG